MALERPRLKGHLRAEAVSDARIFIIGEDRTVLLENPVDVAVVPLMDGRRALTDIVAGLAQRYPIADVFRSITKLEALQLLADGRPDLPDPELAYWDFVGVDAASVVKALPSASVKLVAVGEVDPGPFASVLSTSGIKSEVVPIGELHDPPEWSLVVALVDDYLSPELGELNRLMLAAGSPWLLARPGGVTMWLGPVLRPGQSGCWLCLHQRLSENRQVEHYLRGRRGGGDAALPVVPTPPQAVATAAGFLLPDVIEVLATGRSARLEGNLVTIDRGSFQSQNHTLIRQPQCPACGDAALITERDPRVVLADRQVQFSSDGGYRTEEPAQTFERLSKHISPIIGAVTTLLRVTETESGVTHAYAAGHNFALRGDNMELLRRNLRGQSGGKGRTEIQAKVSAVAEAIERYCGIWRGNEPVRHASYDELGDESRLHIADILQFSDQQYDNRQDLNSQRSGRFHLVPERFRTDVPCDWTTMWSLTHDRPTLVPSSYVWFGHPEIETNFFAFGDGNGNAAGSVREEAILQATCELIERDSVAIWWYNRIQRAAFDIDSLDDPYIETLRRYYRSLDREFWVLDISSDLGIPSFAAISRRLEGPTEDVVLGFGAHLDPVIAVMRALTEMNQFLPSVAMRNPDGSTLYWEDDPATLDWWRTVRIENEPWLVPSSAPPVTVESFPGLVRDSLTADVQGLLDRLASAGFDVLVADQSRPDLELAVVKVIIPGLRHFWRRLGPGRLYDVPVAMGWLAAPNHEDDLNPKSVFF